MNSFLEPFTPILIIFYTLNIKSIKLPKKEFHKKNLSELLTQDDIEISSSNYLNMPLREKCPNTELFLVRIFLYSDWIWRDTPYLSVFSSNTWKYGLEMTPYLDTFHAVRLKTDGLTYGNI